MIKIVNINLFIVFSYLGFIPYIAVFMLDAFQVMDGNLATGTVLLGLKQLSWYIARYCIHINGLKIIQGYLFLATFINLQSKYTKF